MHITIQISIASFVETQLKLQLPHFSCWRGSSNFPFTPLCVEETPVEKINEMAVSLGYSVDRRLTSASTLSRGMTIFFLRSQFLFHQTTPRE